MGWRIPKWLRLNLWKKRIRKKMKKLFDDTVNGLQTQGWVLAGGGDMFVILYKAEDAIKIYEPALHKNCGQLILSYSHRVQADKQ